MMPKQTKNHDENTWHQPEIHRCVFWSAQQYYVNANILKSAQPLHSCREGNNSSQRMCSTANVPQSNIKISEKTMPSCCSCGISSGICSSHNAVFLAKHLLAEMYWDAEKILASYSSLPLGVNLPNGHFVYGEFANALNFTFGWGKAKWQASTEYLERDECVHVSEGESEEDAGASLIASFSGYFLGNEALSAEGGKVCWMRNCVIWLPLM